MAARRYSYPRFLDSQSIRLLRVPPAPDAGTPDDDAKASGPAGRLRLEVAEFPRGCAPNYRALSYAWGPSEDGQTVLGETSQMMSVVLEHEVHDITPNLFDAITQLTLSYGGSYFWIDALCINQNDLYERQVHVAVMDRIYRDANEVVVWLGKSDQHSAAVFALVQRVAAMDDAFFHTFGYATSPAKLCAYRLPDVGSPLWGRYLDLYERRWFSRGWVVQEVILARRAVAHCGGHKVSFDVLVAGSRIFLPERLRKGFFARLRAAEDVDTLPLGRNAYRIGLIKEACVDDKCESLLVVEICTGTYGLASAEHILVHLMRMSRDFRWGDPRDRVYSILGLVNFTARLRGLPSLGLTPDYGKTSTEATVLTTVATAIIKQSGYLGIIAQVSDLSFRKASNLPSWVPDFFRSPNFAMGRKNLFNACGHQPADELFFRFADRCLFVRGDRIGTLQATQDLKLVYTIDDVLGMLAIAYQSRWPAGEDRTEVLWRTMIWDIYGHAQEADDHPAPSFLAESFVNWLCLIIASQRTQMRPDELARYAQTLKALVYESPETSRTHANHTWSETAKLKSALMAALDVHKDGSILPLAASEADPDRFASHASGVTWSQQLFCMDTGYMAMGPKSGKEGDEVWIIAGCPFPMVLRPGGNGKASYCNLGRAYVHGVMHGEAAVGKKSWKGICLE